MNQRARLVCSVSHSFTDFETTDCEIKDTTVSLYRSETSSYVEIYHVDYYAEGRRLAELSKDAGWREFVEILHQQDELNYEVPDSELPIDVFESLEVFGASGIQALALKCAFVRQFYSVGEWIAQQTDDLLDEFGDDIGRLINSDQPDAGFNSLVDLLDVARMVGCGTDIVTLVDRFGNGGQAFDVTGMLLSADAELERLSREIAATGQQAYGEASQKLSLLCDRFKAVKHKYGDVSEEDICGWIGKYCSSNGVFPSGIHKITKSGRYGPRFTGVEIDFEDLIFLTNGPKREDL